MNKARLDETNKQIIRLLSDGRRPYSAIAEELGITENTVRSRVNKLMEDGVLRLDTDGFGKIVWQERSLNDASAEVDMRIDGASAIAGFIVNVSGAADGADAFNGYEVSVNAAERRLVVGKHENNWQPVAEVPLTVSPEEWNRLRVDFDGGRLSVFLNGDRIYDYEDTSNPLEGGYVGLRSYGGSASFRNLQVDGSKIEFMAMADDVENFTETIGVPVSCIRMPLRTMGAQAVEYLIRKIRNPECEKVEQTFRASLVVNRCKFLLSPGSAAFCRTPVSPDAEPPSLPRRIPG